MSWLCFVNNWPPIVFVGPFCLLSRTFSFYDAPPKGETGESPREEHAVRIGGYEDLNLFYGDLHTHCNVWIAYGTAEEALQNVRTQMGHGKR
jgi:hypothetical protein